MSLRYCPLYIVDLLGWKEKYKRALGENPYSTGQINRNVIRHRFKNSGFDDFVLKPESGIRSYRHPQKYHHASLIGFIIGILSGHGIILLFSKPVQYRKWPRRKKRSNCCYGKSDQPANCKLKHRHSSRRDTAAGKVCCPEVVDSIKPEDDVHF